MKEAADRLLSSCSPDDIELDPNGVMITRVAVTLDDAWDKNEDIHRHMALSIYYLLIRVKYKIIASILCSVINV